MAGNPLGQGESNHPSDGNCLLTTISQEGVEIKTPLWINQFSTGLSVQTDSAQLRNKLSHRPVRFAERFLQFTTIWNVANRDKYLALKNTLTDHWIANLNEAVQCTPMQLHYYGANKTWKGFIENWDTAFAITDVILSYTFRMRLILDETKQSEMSALVGTGPYMPTPEGYAPTAYEARVWGDQWYAIEYWMKEAEAYVSYYESKKKDLVTLNVGNTPITYNYTKDYVGSATSSETGDETGDDDDTLTYGGGSSQEEWTDELRDAYHNAQLVAAQEECNQTMNPDEWMNAGQPESACES